MSFLVVAPNGEIVEVGTGIVQGFMPSNFPPLFTDANTLLRHFDGMSAESLGSIPKIVAIGKEEQRLLSKLRPWKFLKWAAQEDYNQLIIRINRQQLSIYRSILMKKMWMEPDSVFNNNWPTRRALYGPSGVKDPVAVSIKKSESAKRSASARWKTRRERYGPTGHKDASKMGKKVWKTRRERYGASGVKDPVASSINRSKAARTRVKKI